MLFRQPRVLARRAGRKYSSNARQPWSWLLPIMMAVMMAGRPAPGLEAGTIGKIQRLPDPALPISMVMPITSAKPENLKIANMIFEGRCQFMDNLKTVFYSRDGRIDIMMPKRIRSRTCDG